MGGSALPPRIRSRGFALVERDGIDLHLNPSEEPPRHHSVCWIGVTNLEALYQEFLPANAIASPLVAQPWGFKECSMCDPFRNLIIFGEDLPEEEARAEPEG
jgi:hypothetical protein